MMHRLNLLLLLCMCCVYTWAQSPPSGSCGQQQIMQDFYRRYPQYKQINEQAEQLLKTQQQLISSGQLKTQRTNGVVTLPVVVHIIHNNGAENITDAQVFQGIQHLNEAFANSGYYDPADGVNTQIQFCMAQRDPSNNPTNGITRDVSAYTVMGGSNYYSDDQNVKNINRWNPNCYINIWLVKSIPTSVVGYAYLPSAHGSPVDGIIEEAAYFGSSYANDVVIIHETGHYLGLYHTFEGNCTNNDCTSDGDKVCDTPPDQSTAGISCSSSANSCTTDVLSGFSTDQNDLTQDYMDYGNFNCMKVFTAGQSTRMNWFIQNTRKSLLACKSCMNPCPAPVTANFTAPAAPFMAGTAYNFTNTSVNAASYEWYVNGVLQGNGANFTYTFPAVGSYAVKLIAKSASALCDDDAKTITLTAVCGVTAGFTKSATTVAAGTNINFTNTATGADSYQWLVNGTAQSSAANFVYTSSTAGDYIIQLIAKNSTVNCQQTFTDTVHYTCSVVTDFTPASTAALINSPVTFTSTGTGGSTYQWLINGVPAGSAATLSYTFAAVGAYTIQLITGNGVCSASKTGLVYVNDKCGNARYLFQKNYAAGQNSSAVDMRPTPDGGAVLAERVIANGSGNSNAALLKLDAAGNTQWMNLYGDNTNTSFKKIKTTADGGYIAIGNIQAAGTQGSLKTFIVKTTATGAASWTRDISIVNAFSNEGNDIIQAADGSYYFTGTLYQPSVVGSSDVLAGKMDASGNLLWIMQYDARSSETGNSLAEDNTHLIICGNKPGQTGNAGFILQVNKLDGTAVWAKSYLSTDENFLDIMVSSKGYFINALRSFTAGGLYTDHVLLATDAAGLVTYSTYNRPFGTAKAMGRPAALLRPNGNILSQASGAFGGTYTDFLLHEVSTTTGNVWAKKYNKPQTWLTAVAAAADNSLWAAGYSVQPSTAPLQTFVIKADSAGNTGNCPSENAGLEMLPAYYTVSNADFLGKQLQPQVSSDHRITPIAVTTGTDCQYVKCDSTALPADTCKLCDSIFLSGPDTLCSLTNTVTYTVKRSPGCPAIPSWHLSDTSAGNITVINDTTISIQFTKAGLLQLIASITTTCKTIEDSINIHVFAPPGSINLGPDLQLCKFSSLKLNAGSGFATYLWNDGSIDSILTVFNPGLYTVTAKDLCGNTYTDNINITLAPDIPFDLGPDLQKCNTDTLTITAPGSFPNYSWAVNYNISSIKGAAVKVWPAVDTTYTVVAALSNGCTVVDTIRITVNKSAPLQLGNDTSFCAGDSLVLKAPAGFSSYLWQDGSAGNSFTALQQGLYWLQAKAANGCISKDSVTINKLYPLPLNFLGGSEEICNGKSLLLQPSGSWATYLWFNNSSSASVTVNTAGKYWLQVTSAQGCKGRDTIEVLTGKNCGTGIHFPNAFTPDHNGNNDTWKPVVFTVPAVYHLLIYNRFGEKLFESSDYKQGWDGMYKGRLQPPDTFVWYCSYQFTGADPRLEKGTLILVR